MNLNFQAKIKKPDGTNLESNSVNYRLKYSAGACTVYVEDFNNFSMTGSFGNISLLLGSGAPVFPLTTTTLFDTFNNDPANAMDCEGGGLQTLNGIEINSVPYAMHASEAKKLGGFAANLYSKFADFTTCTGGQILTYQGPNANLKFSCGTLGSATNFSGVLAGDVTVITTNITGSNNTAIGNNSASAPVTINYNAILGSNNASSIN